MEQQYELTSTPLELVSLAAYVSEGGLVSHHWKERPLGLENFICLSTGDSTPRCTGKALLGGADTSPLAGKVPGCMEPEMVSSPEAV